VLPTVRFSREFEFVFCGVVGFFEDLRVCLFLGFVLIGICLFFGLASRRFLFCWLLFLYFMALLLFQFTDTAYWACFYESLLILGLFFSDCLPPLFLIFLLIFRFGEFSCQHMLGLFYGLITDFWLVFQIYCLFLQNNLASLQTMLGKSKRLTESF